ncbi:hypothetical protein CV_3777 [Chromobacterium violaceum ATCC 12472]|uniref:Uncharacterized protein n=1 Tax=Chromobacterium violaceum (strain ATCC 12472 / DSM 30191 / JCM 1249 / CCUG 213 / NBRC 12614 / NCIMB 9131 / NCTC 9757 / MK) TaxID=243365 RepID=Q7NRK4_CHRVO|nr:hypothetical protein CV_3777 [Chromobacterium violaceum ATCC 12472]
MTGKAGFAMQHVNSPLWRKRRIPIRIEQSNERYLAIQGILSYSSLRHPDEAVYRSSL